jgi:transcriptional regulator of aroF, aroG, tyrA and aromatic amino acid transport
MRIEVICKNRLGILHSIMGILVEFRINLAKGEVGGDDGNAIYFYAPGMLKIQYASVKPMMEKLPGVRRVRLISLMPSERRHSELKTLLSALDHPVLSINTKGSIIAANRAAARAFGQRVDEVPGLSLQTHVQNIDLMPMIERHNARFRALPLVINGKTWLADITPIYADDIITHNPEASLAGAVITLKEMLLVEQDVSAHGELLTDGFGALYPHGKAMDVLVKQAKQFSRLNVPLWISGEEGVGKERLARACHLVGDQAAQPFRKIYCTGFGDIEFLENLNRITLDNPDTTGTLYLTDIHRLGIEAQLRLAQFNDEREASNRSLKLMVSVQEGAGDRLAPELRRALGAYRLLVPSLSERLDGWGACVRDVLDMVCKHTGKPMPNLDDSAHKALREYHWPGNLRELETILLQTVVLAKSRTVSRADLKLPEAKRLDGALHLTLNLRAVELGYREYREYVDRELLGVLYQDYPSARLLGRRLGLSHTAVANRLRKLGIRDS